MVPTKAPKRANSTFWVVYENAIPTMLIVRREPAAKASWVAKTDRKRLGTAIPAMNRVNTTPISSRTNEEAFCLFILFPFTLGRLFQEGILLACALTVGHIHLRKQRRSQATFRAHTRSVPVIDWPLPRGSGPDECSEFWVGHHDWRVDWFSNSSLDEGSTWCTVCPRPSDLRQDIGNEGHRKEAG